jgi:hypothetical protein
MVYTDTVLLEGIEMRTLANVVVAQEENDDWSLILGAAAVWIFFN